MTRNAHPIFFEMARLHAFWGDSITAKSILDYGHRSVHTEWKLGLESIQQRLREGDLLGAVHLNYQLVVNNRGAGRVWSSMIQLLHQYILYQDLIVRSCGPSLAFCIFVYSLQFVAKSGEVWCEGARIFLNPCSSLFSLKNAAKCLNLAVFFTPQYGDSFIEVSIDGYHEI